jgi:transcriptional regulator with XRE-family HTH domain
MSSTHCDTPSSEGVNEGPLLPTPRRLHRLAEVRRRKRVTRKQLAEALRVDVEAVRQQEDESCDLRLSTLYQWQRLLGAPIGELLVDAGHPLALPPLGKRRISGMMKAALTILRESRQPMIRRMASTLLNQLLEMAPQLEGFVAAQGVSPSRNLDSQGRLLPGGLPVKLFMLPPE